MQAGEKSKKAQNGEKSKITRNWEKLNKSPRTWYLTAATQTALLRHLGLGDQCPIFDICFLTLTCLGFSDIRNYDSIRGALKNKLASLEATLVRNYDLPTDGGEV